MSSEIVPIFLGTACLDYAIHFEPKSEPFHWVPTVADRARFVLLSIHVEYENRCLCAVAIIRFHDLEQRDAYLGRK